MKKFFLIISAALIAIAVCESVLSSNEAITTVSFDGSSAAYQAKTAEEKQKLLWTACTKSLNANAWPSVIETLKLFVIDMSKTMNHVSDTMPSGALGFGTRQKVVHSVGVVAKGKFVASPSTRYTGMFRGSDHAIIRLSLANKPSTGADQKMVPGLAVKLLRSRVPSSNLFAIPSLEGQESWNFFASNLSNHIPDLAPDASIVLKKVRDAFAKGSKYPIKLGVNPVARFDQSGNMEKAFKFPYRLLFKPTDRLRARFPDKYNGVEFSDYLMQVEPQKLYDVLAQESPRAPWEPIGHIESTTWFTTSQFGDEQLFFQHHRFEDDLQIKPEWK